MCSDCVLNETRWWGAKFRHVITTNFQPGAEIRHVISPYVTLKLKFEFISKLKQLQGEVIAS